MVNLSREVKRESNRAGLRIKCGMTRRCPHCGAELLWEQDDMGLYVAMDYNSDPHVPHVLSCTGRKGQK